MPNPITPVEWLLSLLNRPASAVAGGVLANQQHRPIAEAMLQNLSGDRQDSFGGVLRQAGVDPKPAALGGFVGDVALDPLNYLFPEALAKEALGKVGEAALKVPFVKGAAQVFSDTVGLPEHYAKTRRLLNSSLSSGRAQQVEEAAKRFEGISVEDRRLASDAIEDPTVLTTITDPARRQKVADAIVAQKQAFADMAGREVGAGVLKQEQVDRILDKNGGYVPYILDDKVQFEQVKRKGFRPVSGNFRFGKGRTLENFEQAKALGAETDLAKLSAIRGAAGDRAVKVNQFLEGVFQNPDWARPAAGLKPEDLPGWRMIETPTAISGLNEKVHSMVVAPEIADDVEKLLSANKERNVLVKALDSVTNMWKGVATTMKPGFHVRNLASNAFNSWLGGMSAADMPLRYAEAMKVVGGAVPANIGSYTGPQLLGAMKEYGVVGREFGFVGDLSDAVGDALKKFDPQTVGSKVLENNPLSLWAKGGKALGTKVEDTSKVALFLDSIRKGLSPEDAALKVKKYLFDYQELTDTEKTLFRRVVPFYTWLRKNVPLQLEHLVTTPGKYSNVASAYKESEQAADAEGISVPKGDRPDFLNKLGAVQAPFTSTSGEKEFFNPNLPFQDLAKTVPSIDNVQDQLSNLHPALKALIELPLNINIYQDRPLWKQDKSEMQLAPMAVQLLAQASPAAARTLGAKPMKVKGEVQWQMPAWSKYAIEQTLPVFNTLGKAAVNMSNGGDTAAPLTDKGPAFATRPPFLDFMAGTKFIPESDQQLARDKKFQRADAKKAAKAKRKEAARELSDEQLRALVGR